MSRLITALFVFAALIPFAAAADKDAPADSKKEGPREAITAFVKELAAEKYDEAYARTTPEYQKTHPMEKWKEGFTRLSGKVDLSKLAVDRVLANEKPAEGHDARAAAVTKFVPADEGRKLAMGFGLIRQEDKWLVRDIDMLPTEESMKEFIDGFKEHEPDATAIPAPDDAKKEKDKDAPKE